VPAAKASLSSISVEHNNWHQLLQGLKLEVLEAQQHFQAHRAVALAAPSLCGHLPFPPSSECGRARSLCAAMPSDAFSLRVEDLFRVASSGLDASSSLVLPPAGEASESGGSRARRRAEWVRSLERHRGLWLSASSSSSSREAAAAGMMLTTTTTGARRVPFTVPLRVLLLLGCACPCRGEVELVVGGGDGDPTLPSSSLGEAALLDGVCAEALEASAAWSAEACRAFVRSDCFLTDWRGAGRSAQKKGLGTNSAISRRGEVAT